MSAKKTNKWLALTTTSLSTLMSTLNSSIVNIANPVLATEFGVTMAQVQWVATIFLICTSSLMLFFGRLGDRMGSHRIYIVGIAIFTVGSVLCALSPGLATLLIARAVQGTGAAMVIAVGMGLVATIFPQEQRGRALGINVLMVGLGNIAGPSVGGLVLSFATWHYVFLLSVPFGLLAFTLAAIWLRSPLPRRRDTSLDVVGSLLFVGVIASLILFLSGGFDGQEWFGLVFVALLAGFVLVQRRSSAPLLEPALLRNKRFILGNLIAFLSYSASMMLTFQIPFFLDEVWGIPVASVGLLMMVSALCLAVSGPVSGFLSDRFGALRLMPLALVALIVCMILALFLGVEVAIGFFVLVMALSGIGMGLLNTPNNSEIMTAAGRTHASFASGFVGTNRNLAFCIGTALSASIFTASTRFLELAPESVGLLLEDAVMVHVYSFRIVLLVCLLLVLASLTICLYLKRSDKPQKKEEV